MQAHTGTYAASPTQRQGNLPPQGTHTSEFTVVDFSTKEVLQR